MQIDRSDIKVAVRYLVLAFILHLSYIVVQAEYLERVKALDPMIVTAVIASVFGALTFVLKYHFETSPGTGLKKV